MVVCSRSASRATSRSPRPCIAWDRRWAKARAAWTGSGPSTTALRPLPLHQVGARGTADAAPPTHARTVATNPARGQRPRAGLTVVSTNTKMAEHEDETASSDVKQAEEIAMSRTPRMQRLVTEAARTALRDHRAAAPPALRAVWRRPCRPDCSRQGAPRGAHRRGAGERLPAAARPTAGLDAAGRVGDR